MSNEYGSDFMTIIDEDGTEYELEILSTLEYNGETYLAVTPATDEDVEVEVSILKSVEEDGESILCVIEDEDELQAIPDIAPNMADSYVQQNEIEQIQKILHDVNEPYKEVFMWRVYAELSFKQIAQIFGKTENWACVTYHRARKMIKERLEEKSGEN